MNALLLAQALGYLLAGGMALTIPVIAGSAATNVSSWRRLAGFALLHGLALWCLLLHQILPLEWLPWVSAGLDLVGAWLVLDAACHLAADHTPTWPRILATGTALIAGAALVGSLHGHPDARWSVVIATAIAASSYVWGKHPWMTDRIGHGALNAGLALIALVTALSAWMEPSPNLDIVTLVPLAVLLPALIQSACPPVAQRTSHASPWCWRHPLIVIVPCLGLGILIGSQIIEEQGELQRHHLTANVRVDLEVVEEHMRETWSRGAQAAAFVTSWPETTRLLAPDASMPLNDPQHVRNRTLLESRIDALAVSQGLSLVYLLNASGTVCATSNRGSSTSLEGKNFAFRPYFSEAMAHGTGRLVSMGTTTGRRGVYTSASVRAADGTIIGVAVIKQDLAPFHSLLRQHPHAIIVDADGNVAASSHEAWIGRRLAPPSESISSSITAHQGPDHIGPAQAPILADPLQAGIIRGTDGTLYLCALSAHDLDPCRLIALTNLRPNQRQTAWLTLLVTLANVLILAVFTGAAVLIGHSQSLRRNRALLHDIIERATDAIIVLQRHENGHFHVVLANPMVRRYLPSAHTALIGQDWHTLSGIAQESWLSEAIQRSWASDHITVIEQSIGQGSEERWLRCTLAQHDHLLTLTITDITGHRHTEEERRRQRDFIRRILDADPNPVLLRNPDGCCLFVNRACTELVGMNADDITGKSLAEILPVPDDAIGLIAGDHEVLAQGIQHDSEIALTLADGRVRIFMLTKRPMRLADGRNCLYASATDVTALRNALDDAQRARLEAEVATRAKDGFLATMGHEIRTPLNGVLGMLQLLQRTTLSDLQNDYIRTARRSAESLLGLLNDLLDFAKIEAGHLDLDHTAFDLRQTMHDTLDQCHDRYDPEQVELVVRIAPDLPTTITGDAERFRQIVSNLVGNALKFTERGHVLVQLDQEALGSLRHLRLRITDTGIGITPEQQARLFRAFEMGDASTTRRFGGTGLGLALSKRLVDVMGGTIAVSSQSGEGSTFTILLPLTGDPAHEISPDLDDMLANQHIVVVDDHALARTTLSEALAHAGATVTAYASGGEMLAALYSADHERPITAMVIDQLMPDMSGEDVVRALRADTQFNHTMLILAVSRSSRCSPAQAAEIGCDGYLTKPIIGDDLSAMVAEIERHRTSGNHALITRETLNVADTSLTTLVASTPLNATILLVDDNPVNVEVARILVARYCTTVLVADNGYQALDLVEHQHIDLVLMDVQMPGMDGFATTAAIRRREAEQAPHDQTAPHLPIIALTGSLTNDARAACRTAGMDDHCKKPLTTAALQALLARWLEHHDDASSASGTTP